MAARRSYGTGSLLEKADSAGRVSWYGQWRHNGVQVKRRIGLKRTAGSRDGLGHREAEAELRRMIGEIKPSAAVAERLGLAEVSRRYVREAKRRGRKPSTCENIESETRVHLDPFFTGKTLEAIGKHDVEDLLATLEGKGLAPKTVKNILATLSALFIFAHKRGWAGENPCEGVEPPAASPSTEIRFLTLAEVDAMIAHAPEGMFRDIDRALWLTAALTGLRKGELLALRWRDVDWPARRVRVRRGYTRGAYGTPKSGRSRSVPMADEVGGALDRLYQPSRWQADHDLVFAHPETGGVLAKSNISRRMKAALRAAALDDMHRFHDLRHTFGTRCAAEGVPMRTLQEWMGHADLKTTEIYAHYAPGAHEAEMIERVFARSGPEAPMRHQYMPQPSGSKSTQEQET
jgi:integrase